MYILLLRPADRRRPARDERRYDVAMIRHIVLWRLKPEGRARFPEIKSALEAQLGRIPGLLRVEVGQNIRPGRRAVDFALTCDFADLTSLEAYHKHPAHHETRATVDPFIEDHWIADHEI